MNTLMEQAIEALFEGKLDDKGTLEGKVLSAFWRGIKIEIESALRDAAGVQHDPEPASKEEEEWMNAPMGKLPTMRPSKCKTQRGRYTRRSSTRKPWMKAAVALLADGEHTDRVARDCGVPVQVVRRFKGTHAEYIEELSRIPHGEGRFKYIQTHFKMGLPEDA